MKFLVEEEKNMRYIRINKNRLICEIKSSRKWWTLAIYEKNIPAKLSNFTWQLFLSVAPSQMR